MWPWPGSRDPISKFWDPLTTGKTSKVNHRYNTVSVMTYTMSSGTLSLLYIYTIPYHAQVGLFTLCLSLRVFVYFILYSSRQPYRLGVGLALLQLKDIHVDLSEACRERGFLYLRISKTNLFLRKI